VWWGHKDVEILRRSLGKEGVEIAEIKEHPLL